MWSRRCRGAWAVALALAWSVLAGAGSALAADEEGCLFCHRLELRAPEPLPEGTDLRVWEAPGGTHAALYCSECHADAGKAPHAATPGPARCLGECHAQSATAKESHRRASFGGLVEAHRGLASPSAPCRACHHATDKAGNVGAIVARCAGCHDRPRDSVARGVHARVPGRGGAGMCPDCHVPHPAAGAGGKASCAGSGCHAAVTDRMKRLAAHAGSPSEGTGGRGAAEAGVVFGIAAAGLLLGRRLSPAGKAAGGTG